MNVFEIRRQLINDYSTYIRSFIKIRDRQIDRRVQLVLVLEALIDALGQRLR